ncbi:type 2 periplasmic-binding domain-containing protein [Massilibacterium senegalense]|uniref:hypothetical protein n=1 Tax=Massilibacterium senegalense TaxID=1632858 RepID=UPI0012B60E9E|nr:hypothetical protein [Massilibacterium senegalense]
MAIFRMFFNQLYPNVKVFIETTDQVKKAVLENQTDVGMDFLFESEGFVVSNELYDEEF